jgi:hypothetical protein
MGGLLILILVWWIYIYIYCILLVRQHYVMLYTRLYRTYSIIYMCWFVSAMLCYGTWLYRTFVFVCLLRSCIVTCPVSTFVICVSLSALCSNIYTAVLNFVDLLYVLVCQHYVVICTRLYRTNLYICLLRSCIVTCPVSTLVIWWSVVTYDITFTVCTNHN